MALEVRFYTNYSKRDNSTKRPAATAPYTTANVVLKEPTSIESPTLLLSGNHFNYEYAYIPSYNKYYFVSQHVSAGNNLTQISLDEDVMATYKSNIGSTVAHIAYSSTGYDVDIVDPRIAVKSSKHIYANSEASGLSNNGCYIVGVINENAKGRQGAINYYVMAEANMTTLMNKLTDTNFWNQITQYFTGDFLQLVPLCIWIPIPYGTACNLFCGNGVIWEDIYIGKENTGATGYPVNNPVVDLDAVSIDIPFKWQDFRDSQPYTAASLYLVGIGDTDLNINDFYESTKVSIATKYDATTGDMVYKVYNDEGKVLKTVMFNACANLALAHVTTGASGSLSSVGGLITSGAGIALSALTGNALGFAAGAVGALASATSSVLSFNQRSTSIKGANTGRAAFNDITHKLTLVCYDTEDPDDLNYIARFGRPVAKTQTINSHSGYVQCESASVDIPGTEAERSKINSYLNGGFYYE